ncbi:hypothetical protein COLO4_22170 [Corchorus olitorius]|uniref:Uncharacterized protein n=1 Tax=Corchorus olitorius TaxID=93759 RepID=A0A1R3INS1_9ROSI|nr:hypothetical protein COLO4_22170 [Corchorus olitorius]
MGKEGQSGKQGDDRGREHLGLRREQRTPKPNSNSKHAETRSAYAIYCRIVLG